MQKNRALVRGRATAYSVCGSGFLTGTGRNRKAGNSLLSTACTLGIVAFAMALTLGHAMLGAALCFCSWTGLFRPVSVRGCGASAPGRHPAWVLPVPCWQPGRDICRRAGGGRGDGPWRPRSSVTCRRCRGDLVAARTAFLAHFDVHHLAARPASGRLASQWLRHICRRDGMASMKALPLRPARPVRPMRWT